MFELQYVKFIWNNNNNKWPHFYSSTFVKLKTHAYNKANINRYTKLQSYCLLTSNFFLAMTSLALQAIKDRMQKELTLVLQRVNRAVACDVSKEEEAKEDNAFIRISPKHARMMTSLVQVRG